MHAKTHSCERTTSQNLKNS